MLCSNIELLTSIVVYTNMNLYLPSSRLHAPPILQATRTSHPPGYTHLLSSRLHAPPILQATRTSHPPGYTHLLSSRLHTHPILQATCTSHPPGYTHLPSSRLHSRVSCYQSSTKQPPSRSTTITTHDTQKHRSIPVSFPHYFTCTHLHFVRCFCGPVLGRRTNLTIVVQSLKHNKVLGLKYT